jgi:hypothetical protein
VFLKELDQTTAEKRIIEVIRQIEEATALTLSYGIAPVNIDCNAPNLLAGAIDKAQRAMEQHKSDSG